MRYAFFCGVFMQNARFIQVDSVQNAVLFNESASLSRDAIPGVRDAMFGKQIREARLIESLMKIQVSPFFLPIQCVGVFGGTRPTVVWTGVGKGHPHLYALHHHIQAAQPTDVPGASPILRKSWRSL